MQSLTKLVMKGNYIGCAAAVSLVSISSVLQSLDLGSVGLVEADMASFWQAFGSCAGSSGIMHLFLNGNHVGDRAVKQMCAALQSNKQLERVGLAGCHLGASSARRLLALAEAVARARVNRGRHRLQVCDLGTATQQCDSHKEESVLLVWSTRHTESRSWRRCPVLLLVAQAHRVPLL